MFTKKEVIVLARARSFWTTRECRERFAKMVLLPESPTHLSYLFYGLWGLVLLWWYRPVVLVLGTSMDFVPYYLRLKGAGFWPATKVLTDNQHLSNRILAAVDRLIVYSLEEKHMYDESLRDRLVFVPYPAKSGLVPLESIAGDYIFCGGSNKRDHRAFVEAMRGLPLKAIIVTEKPLPKDIPPNCEVRGRLPLEDYFALMARAKVVAVPLIKSDMPHGHSDISGALSLGKVVVTTKDASCGGYITDGVEGLLVPAGDIEGYRQAFVTLCKDSTKWAQMSAAALSKSRVFTYGVFGDRLVDLVRSMMPVNEINHQN